MATKEQVQVAGVLNAVGQTLLSLHKEVLALKSPGELSEDQFQALNDTASKLDDLAVRLNTYFQRLMNE